MKEFKGTKGEWKYYHRIVDEEGNYITQVFSNHTVICDMHWAGERINNVTYSRRSENAKLISAAPDLLEALLSAYRCSGERNYLTKPVLDQMLEAINKALD